MTNTEIKKATYKEKPQANFKMIRSGVAYYCADLENYRVEYEVPVNDMGTADFTRGMDAKLMNRWIANAL